MDNLLTSFSMKKKIPNKFENCAIKFVCSVFEQIKKRTQYMKGPPKKKGKFETYLLLRQYPLYNKTESPAVLAPHFNDDEFQKSQAYGKDKAKFSIFSGLVRAVWFCYDSLWVLCLGLGYSWSFPSAIWL